MTVKAESSRGSASGSDVDDAIDKGDGRMSTSRMVQERRPRKWLQFLVGNVLSAVAVIWVIGTFYVCFDEDVVKIDIDTKIAGFQIVKHVEYDGSTAYKIVIFAQVFALFIEVFSAFFLSWAYCSPLDIKSVHKISFNDSRSTVGSSFQFVVAPLSWAIIYGLGGVASLMFFRSPPCGGHNGRWLDLYLQISGGTMLVSAFIFLVVSVLVCPLLACRSPSRCTDWCCACLRGNIHRHILSYGLYLEIIWQLQGVMWAYRMGAFGLAELFIVGALSIVGEALASWGSVAPVTRPAVTVFVGECV